MSIRSIHVRLILWYTALVIFVSIGFGAYTYYSFSHRLYGEMQETLARRVLHVRDDILPQIASNSPESLARQIQEIYSPEESSRFIRISRVNGALIYISGAPQDHAFNPATIAAPIGYINHITARTESIGSGTNLFIVGLQAASAGAEYLIEMGAPTNQIDSTLRKLILTLLIGLPAIIAIAVVGGSLLVRRALQPVEVIRATAEKITYGNLRQRLPVAATDDALEHLSVTLNQMLDRLDQSFQEIRRFSADASHELRTPLTIIRSGLETVETTMKTWDWPLPLRERIGSILEETEQLSRIVEGLLDITRLDAGEGKIDAVALNLVELVRSTVEQMQLLAEEKRISVNVQASEPVFVAGDAARIRQIVVNLLDNAVKYTSAGGTIILSVHREHSKAVLRIKDNGIGISAEALPHIFERFYRADKVRSRATQGAGLGLSIVRAICQAHGGTVQIQSTEGTGTIVIIELPLADKNLQENFNAAA